MDKKLLLGVAGNPVFHSKSPDLFRKFFRFIGIDGSYIRVNVRSCEEIIDLFNKLNFKALNITAPFKTDIINFIDELSEDAEASGAVNLICKYDHGIKGYNTDHSGVVNTLKNRNIQIKGKKIIVIGTGGAARGAVYGLRNAGADVFVTGRSREKAMNITEKLSVDFIDQNELKKKLQNFKVVINTIPVNRRYFNPEYLSDGSTVFNADYSGTVSFNTSAYKRKRIRILTGYEWLYFQAIHTLEVISAVSKIEPLPLLNDREVIDEIVDHKFKNEKRDRIFLTGFTGSGKSVLGKIVSDNLGFDFIDIDLLAEKEEKMKVAEIFRKYGEEYFRSLENRLLSQILGKRKVVISGGAGIVISEKNRMLIKENSIVIWIYRDLEKIYDSADRSLRPLIDGKNVEDLGKLFDSRKAFYFSASDILFYNDDAPERVAGRICDDLSKNF